MDAFSTSASHDTGSAFDYGSYAAAGFEDAGLAKKGVKMLERKDGLYSWEKCDQATAG